MSSGPGVGYEYPRTDVSWMKRDVLLFAVSIGCTVDELHFIYVRPPDLSDMRRSKKLTEIGTPSRFRRVPDVSHHSP
jgi:hypothetical protein